MKKLEKIFKGLKALSTAVLRYPVTVLFLFGAVVLNAVEINRGYDKFAKVVFSLMIGALFGMVAQVIYERFYKKTHIRFLFMGAAFLLTVGFYGIIRNLPDSFSEIYVRIIVTAFALVIAFIWIPTIKNSINFNQSFMASFKGFFITLLFSTTIYLGISIILAAIEQLLMPIDRSLFVHMANIVYLLFAPLYFLSLIPAFGAAKREEKSLTEDIKEKTNISSAISCPKYLEIFISYIIVPITGIFTLILLIYIVRNIGGEFWTDNLLEPMLVFYSITVIVVYILTSELTNKSALIFKKVFPKLLVPIVLFQTIASVIRIGEMGITYGRYYVILYGIFAFLSGIVFIILPVGRNGFIAWILILFSVISMVPPIDAFTVSRISQISLLESVLYENSMLENNHIIPNNELSKKEQERISRIITYLNEMGYTEEIVWLDDYTKRYDFVNTFGFYENFISDYQTSYFYGELDRNATVNITDYNCFAVFNLWLGNGSKEVQKKGNILIDGQEYLLVSRINENEGYIALEKENGEEIIGFDMYKIIERFEEDLIRSETLSLEESTFTVKNSMAELTIILENMNLNKSSGGYSLGVKIYVFARIK